MLPKSPPLMPQSPNDSKAGFAAVDALVAVTVLASSLSLSLVAAEVSARASRAASETRAAEGLLCGRLHQFDGSAGSSSGTELALTWRMDAVPTAHSERPAPCILTTTAEGKKSSRKYQLQTLALCHPIERP